MCEHYSVQFSGGSGWQEGASIISTGIFLAFNNLLKSREEVHHTLICPEMELYNMLFFSFFSYLLIAIYYKELWKSGKRMTSNSKF